MNIIEKKIVLYLSGKWDSKVSRLIGDEDIVLCAPGLKPGIIIKNCIELPRTQTNLDKKLSDWIVEEHLRGENSSATKHLECFLNEFYQNSLQPLLALLIELKQSIDRYNIETILIVCVRSNCSRIPMLGFQTLESLRGANDLLGSRFSNILPIVFPHIRFRYKYVSGSFWIKEPIRRMIISTANIIYATTFTIKILILNHFHKIQKVEGCCKNIIVVRTEHQMRFAQKLLKRGGAVELAIIPQISQGTLKSLIKLRKTIPPSYPICHVTIKILIQAASNTFRDIKALQVYSKGLKPSTFSFSGLSIPINLSDIIDDIKLMSVTIFYKNILSLLLNSKQPTRLINFELVSRMAGLHALAAFENNVESVTVQTAVVESVSYPVFPLTDKFYADSYLTLSMIADNGSKKNGRVVYVGPPYMTKPIRELQEINSIAYFTQPYEIEVTLQIIANLCRFTSKKGLRLTLRLHPRDRIENYNILYKEFSNEIHYEQQMSLEEIINSHDLSVTRTSSVAKESLANGVPIILCLWSDLDRSAKVDFIVPELRLGYCSRNEMELLNLLNDPRGLTYNANILVDHLFDKKNLANLSARIFE